MAKLSPKIDKFTQNLNKTIPSATENLPAKVRDFNTKGAIGNIKGEICNKIEGVVGIATSIKSGASSLVNKASNFSIKDTLNNAVDSFFEGPVEDLKGKLNDVVDGFKGAFDDFKKQDLNLQKLVGDQIDQLEKELTEKFESVKIAAAGFGNALNDVKNFTNKTVRDITTDPLKRLNLEGGLCGNAQKDLIDTALTQKSVANTSNEQDELIEKSSNLIDLNETNDKLLEETVTSINSNKTVDEGLQTSEVTSINDNELTEEDISVVNQVENVTNNQVLKRGALETGSSIRLKQRKQLREELTLELLNKLKQQKESGVPQEQINENHRTGLFNIAKTVDERLPKI